MLLCSATRPWQVRASRSCCGVKRRDSPLGRRSKSGSPEPGAARARSAERRLSRPSTSSVVRGRMLIVDASCLYEVLAGTPGAEQIRRRLAADGDHAAPHVIDVEVLGVIRRDFLLGRLDATAATQAIDDLRDWPGDRFGHRPFLVRAWELRANVRGWDAMYVALAEALQATLITTDERLGRVPGLLCPVEVMPGEAA